MKKSTLISLAVFALLAIAMVATLRRTSERGISRVSFASVDKDKVDRMELSGANTAKLSRKGELWVLEDGKEADGQAVTRAVETIAKVVSSDLVTKVKDRFAELEVDEAKGTRVQAFVGSAKVADFVMGKAGQGGTHVRVGDEVYLVKQVYAGMFAKQAAAWVEKRIFKKTGGDATSVEVRLAGQAPYTLTKNGAAWELTDKTGLPADYRFDAGLAASLAGAVAGLRAKDVLSEKPAADVAKLDSGDVVAVTFKAEKEGSPELRGTLRLGATKDDDKSVYAAVDGRDLAFTVAEATAKQLRKSLVDLRDLTLVSFDASKAKGLAVVDGKSRTVFSKKDGAWALASTTEKTPEGFEFDPAAVERRVSAIATSKAQQLADSSASGSGLGAPVAKVVVTLEDGKTVDVVFGKSVKDGDRELVYVKGSTYKETYLATPWIKTNLTGGLATFKKQPMPAGGGMPNLDPKALENLPPEVRASLMKQLQDKQREQELIKQLQQAQK